MRKRKEAESIKFFKLIFVFYYTPHLLLFVTDVKPEKNEVRLYKNDGLLGYMVVLKFEKNWCRTSGDPCGVTGSIYTFIYIDYSKRFDGKHVYPYGDVIKR